MQPFEASKNEMTFREWWCANYNRMETWDWDEVAKEAWYKSRAVLTERYNQLYSTLAEKDKIIQRLESGLVATSANQKIF